METIIAQLLQDFENGKMNRRQLIQSLAVAAAAASAVAVGTSTVEAAPGFKAVALDHISYEVANYGKTRDFYADLLGMTVSKDNGTECELGFDSFTLIARNRPSTVRASRVDHIAYRIDDWSTAKVNAELERRKLKPRLDTGGPLTSPNFASFHVQDPDGFDLQITGVAKPGDSLYKKPGN